MDFGNDVASIHMELAIESDCTELKLSHLNGKPIFKSKTFEKVKSDFKKIVIQIVENPEATVKTFSISASGKEEKLKEIFEASAGYKLKVETITWFLGGFTKEDFQMFSAVFDMKHLKTIRFKMPGEGLGWLMDELNDVNKCLMFVDKSRKNKEWKYLMNLENLDFVKDVIELFTEVDLPIGANFEMHFPLDHFSKFGLDETLRGNTEFLGRFAKNNENQESFWYKTQNADRQLRVSAEAFKLKGLIESQDSIAE